MINLEYKGYTIHIVPKDMTSARELTVSIVNKELESGFTFIRKVYYETTNYECRSVGLFHDTTEKQVFHDYYDKETIEELIDESKLIIEYLGVMETKITAKVEKKLLNIKFANFEPLDFPIKRID